jgi:hypothetical protein
VKTCDFGGENSRQPKDVIAIADRRVLPSFFSSSFPLLKTPGRHKNGVFLWRKLRDWKRLKSEEPPPGRDGYEYSGFFFLIPFDAASV